MAAKIILLALFSQALAQDGGFSTELQEAIDFCGGLTQLTDGNCPPQDPVDESDLKREFLPAKNIKLCKAR